MPTTAFGVWSSTLEEQTNPSRERRTRKGRGALTNKAGRFESLRRDALDDGWGSLDEEPPPLRTTVTKDASRSVIARNKSPDVHFDQSINPYRGCEHGCIYCFARPTHAWLGYSPGTDFESRLLYKPDVAKLLTGELAKRSYECSPIGLGTNTDPYQPIEKRLRCTRQILEVLSAYDHPVTIVTKSGLIERDIDLLAPMAERKLASVSISVTSLDRELSRKMEPRAAAPQRRIRTIERLTEAGIPTGVLVAPIIPALNDHEIEKILETVHIAGALSAGYSFIRLPLEIKDLFIEWLETHYPLKADHVLNRLRDLHNGKLYDATFSTRQTGTGVFSQLVSGRFRLAVKRLGFPGTPALDRTQFRRPNLNRQLGLFDAD